MHFLCNNKKSMFLTAWLLWGCGTLVGNPEDENNSQQRSADDLLSRVVTFNIADAPIDDAVSVFITIKSIEIKPENNDWVAVPLLFTQEIDLLRYQDGASIAFAQSSLVAEGLYTDTRLILSDEQSPRIVLSDGREKTMQVEAFDGVVAIKKPFTVVKGQPVEVTLDFDLRKSLRVLGEGGSREYVMAPVIRMVKAGEFGEIVGEAIEGNVVCVYPFEFDMDDSDKCENAINSAKVKNGKYTLPFMPKGSYKIRVFDKQGKVKGNDDEKNAHEVVPKNNIDEIPEVKKPDGKDDSGEKEAVNSETKTDDSKKHDNNKYRK